MSLEQHRQEMLALHRCRDSKGVREDAEGVSCWAFDCDIPVRLCEHGGGEPWPGTRTTDRCAGEAADFPAAEMMWSFFQQVEPLKPK